MKKELFGMLSIQIRPIIQLLAWLFLTLFLLNNFLRPRFYSTSLNDTSVFGMSPVSNYKDGIFSQPPV